MEKVNGRKLSLIFIFILILLVIALLVSKLTFSYLGPTLGEDLSNEGEVTASGDTLIFTKGSNLSLSATTDNFQTGGSNLSSTTNPKVRLIASSKTNSASATYYVGVVINSNSYTYTTSDNTAEVILTIKDENGNNVTSGVDGLTYVTSGGVSGFDVTGKKGLFNIKTDYPISTTSSSTGTTHTWTFTLTFVNLGTDQSENENASMDLDIYLQKTKVPTSVAEACTSGDNLADCIVTLSDKSASGITNIYHHDGSLANGIDDGSYRYAGGDYVLTEEGKATGATMMIGYNNTLTTALIDFYCNGTKYYVGSECISSQTHYYLIKGDTTQHQTYNETLNKAVEKGYLTKDNVKNFVCFGSDATTCPTENLYRIIGVFNNQVKLIKYDYAKSSLLGTDGDYSKEYAYKYYSGEQGESPSSDSLYYWNSSRLNTWSESDLNKVNLNVNYINNLGNIWTNKIATTTWKVGGNTVSDLTKVIPSIVYKNEVVSPVNNTTYDAKIGLMYISDYYYSADPSAWLLTGYKIEEKNQDFSRTYAFAKEKNWLYGGGDDWTISCRSDDSDYAFLIDSRGLVFETGVFADRSIRPVFNLESSVSYVSGTGTQSDPIIIN